MKRRTLHAYPHGIFPWVLGASMILACIYSQLLFGVGVSAVFACALLGVVLAFSAPRNS